MFQQEHGAAGRGQAPHFQKLTKIDLPELDVHQQFFDDGEEAGAGAKATLSSEESDASQQNEAKGIIDIKTFLK